MTFVIYIGLIVLSIERLFAPWMFTYQIINMLENEQTLVENHKYVPERCLFYINRYHGPQ